MASQQFIRFLVNTYGVSEISSAIGQLRRRLDTMQPVLEDIGQIYVDLTKKRIESQTDPKGRVWKHNAKSTQRLKAKGMRGRGPAIEGPNKRLVWTGKLRENIKYRVGGNTVFVISDVPYAPYVHFGVEKPKIIKVGAGVISKPWGIIPPRPFLGTNKKTNELVASKLGEYLLGNKVAKKLGFSS